MTITRIRLKRFTAFEHLDLRVSPGINVLIGENGTGKTHLLKVAYAACDVSKTKADFTDKLVRVFLPSGRAPGRLVKRQQGSVRGEVDVWRGQDKLRVSFSNHTKSVASATVTGFEQWTSQPVESVFIPVKEMLSNGPGFRSLYAQREVHFEEIYADILDRAYRPALRGAMDQDRKRVLTHLQRAIDGRVNVQNEEFFLKNKHGNLEFTLLAEGMRKLGLLWLLVQNGTLLHGAVLFWDEPETNLNPKLFGVLMGILLQLQRLGVQVFLATHDYAILKELELGIKPGDEIRCHALYRDADDGQVQCESKHSPFELEHSAIAEAFASLYDRELKRALRPAQGRETEASS
ncbi:AAA family ATPase [Haliangium sp.]|uniref:AAA family ATPase n=1 Tax=Haliangium sp. TaxID=2663208 RepID=UPI003D11D2D9